MATTDSAATSTVSSNTLGAALAQPTIAFISAQITASVPAGYANAILAQFAGGSTASGQAPAAAPPIPAATLDAFGASLAAPAIAFISAQITASVPPEYASLITAQFAGAPAAASSGSMGQVSAVPDALKSYFSGLNTSSI